MTEVLMWHSKKPRRLRLRGFSIPFWVGGLIPRLAEVSSALVTAQQTAAAAQALHAGTMHQQLLSGKAGADQPERETEPVQKRSWFSRFFGD